MKGNRERLVYHVDVNSAFLSWESVHRLHQNPQDLDLRTIPSVVGGDAKNRHGIVLAKSISAKAFGIITGEPILQAMRKCPGLIVAPSHFEIYIAHSKKLIALLEEYTPDIEKFSIDEAFLDMTSTIHLFGDPIETANQIRKRVEQELEFTVNIGIASNKLLAKMASDFQKPNRFHTLFYDEIPTKLWPLPIRDLFFVGASAQKKLENIGIHTIGQLAACEPSILTSHLGNKYATLIHQYACGIDDEPVAAQEAASKGCGNSITLSKDVTDYETAYQVLLSLSETVGARLRADHIRCSSICVEIKDWEFRTQSHQMGLPESTDSTAVIFEQSCNLLKSFWNLTPLRLLGIRTTKLTDDGYTQLSLFETEKSKKIKTLEKTVDTIRGKYGTDSIKRASFLKKDSIVDHAAGKTKHL